MKSYSLPWKIVAEVIILNFTTLCFVGLDQMMTEVPLSENIIGWRKVVMMFLFGGLFLMFYTATHLIHVRPAFLHKDRLAFALPLFVTTALVLSRIF